MEWISALTLQTPLSLQAVAVPTRIASTSGTQAQDSGSRITCCYISRRDFLNCTRNGRLRSIDVNGFIGKLDMLKHCNGLGGACKAWYAHGDDSCHCILAFSAVVPYQPGPPPLHSGTRIQKNMPQPANFVNFEDGRCEIPPVNMVKVERKEPTNPGQCLDSPQCLKSRAAKTASKQRQTISRLQMAQDSSNTPRWISRRG